LRIIADLLEWFEDMEVAPIVFGNHRKYFLELNDQEREKKETNSWP